MAKLRNLSGIKIPNRTALFTWGGGDVKHAGIVNESRPFIEKSIELAKVEPRLSLYFKGVRNMGRAFDLTMVDLGDTFTHTIDNYDWGKTGKGVKRFRGGRTWQKITDSGSLRDSQKMRIMY